ncbi:uncharacterized protein N7515_001165 [Penicillium bovifimosum]|uniref:Uncharacterized protein n=1 Tax=Penicillium bovifimosum TaxID=126998 RepID=A0A9W9HG16_9EURO|nr:uncharacterized protein N7515_001165 [Penicillium bovifimosum]KAJ5146601.1 hypothetical protein N7515_001165 [Penicillium bovifimosum]
MEIQPQQSYSDLFRLTHDGTGSSLKVSTEWRSSKVTQIEYSACFGNESNIDCGPPNMIYYDLSKINDPSNAEYSVRIEPSFACWHEVGGDEWDSGPIVADGG